MKSESLADSDDESNLVIVTSTQTTGVIKQETSEYHNQIYSDDVIENLWNARAMGSDGPEEILLSLWYFVSHYFGIRSRTDHAKLSLGNVTIENENGTKKLIFTKDISSLGKDVTVFTTKFPSRAMCEVPENKARCPVTIYETYLNHRPSNFSYPTSPFYLQPDKSVQTYTEGPWYAAAGLGKNRIGSLFNSALSRCGQPVVRHYSSRRQIINEASVGKSQPAGSTVASKAVDCSPKIKLKICHLSSGNPIVTQTMSEETGDGLIKSKLRSATAGKSGARKRSAQETVDVKMEQLVDAETSRSSEELDTLPVDIKTESDDGPITKYTVKPTKRNWSLQKSIVSITCKESNPIIRQIMMQLSMNKDILTPLDNKTSSSSGPKTRLLRRSVKLSHLQLPMWPTMDKFCDSELQRSMKYSFDDTEQDTVATDDSDRRSSSS